MDNSQSRADWMQSDSKSFWNEIAPLEHIVQFYEDDNSLLNLLESFVGSGLKADESVVVIATKEHIQALNARLWVDGFNLTALTMQNQFIFLEAEETLARFMVNGMPDETLFLQLAAQLMKRARQNERPVRAFGEMVALLWAEGNKEATVKLEQLWNKFCEQQPFSLLCAYPEKNFEEAGDDLAAHICCSHSKMIRGSVIAKQNIHYKVTAAA